MGRYCAETFRALGHEAVLFDSGSLTRGEKLFLRPIARFRRQNNFEKIMLNRRLDRAAAEFRPDFFLAIFGFDIFPETVAAIRARGAKTACWWLNDPFQFPRGLAIAPSYDRFFSNCERSARDYVRQGIASAAFLPHAAFEPVHRPVEMDAADRRKWQSEICFVGDWGPVRQGILSMLSQKADLRIWGPWRKHLTPRDRLWSRVVDGYFTPEQMIRALCGAKIALNLHSWFGYYDCGLNPRTFETPGCGALQVCDWKEELPRHFTEGAEVVTYRTGEELEGKIRELLADDKARRQIAEAGLRRARAEHTYSLRMKQMLEMLKME